VISLADVKSLVFQKRWWKLVLM